MATATVLDRSVADDSDTGLLVAVKPTLRQVRLRKLWSPNRLSAESGVATTTILAIERGARVRVRLGTIEKLARALDMDPYDISWPGNPLGNSDEHEAAPPS